MVDTCQAKKIEGNLDFRSLAKRSAASAFALLAAARGDEESQEYRKGEHGLFTYALLDGLGRPPHATLDGLFRYTSEFVARHHDPKVGAQTPQLLSPPELRQMRLD